MLTNASNFYYFGRHTPNVFVQATWEYKKFKQYILHKVGFESARSLMIAPPLNMYLWNAKVLFVGSHHLPTFWSKKQKATTKVTLTSQQKLWQAQKILNNVQSEILTALFGSVNSDQGFGQNPESLASIGIAIVCSWVPIFWRTGDV